MAASYSDSGARQQVPGRGSPKQQVTNSIVPKQKAPDRFDSRPPDPKQPVTDKPSPKQQVASGPTSKQGAADMWGSQLEILRSRALNVSPASVLAVSEQIDPYRGDPNFMTSLARGLAVIQAFSQCQRELTVSQITAKTGLSRAAVRRCLYTLNKLGFAASNDSRHFHLLPRVLALGHSYISSMPLAAMAQPILENVSHILHESCSIATLDRTDIVYIARANVTRIMSIDLVVGSRLPAFCTSMGRDRKSTRLN